MLKLHAHQSVAEALTILNNEDQECLPVYDQETVIGKITYADLRAFVSHDGNPGSISAFKLHFDLGAALPAIKAIQLKQHKKIQNEATIKKWTARLGSVAVILVVLFGFAWLLFEPINSPYSDQEETALPDSNNITLTLASGKILTLERDKNGIIINPTEITYNDGSRLEVEAMQKVSANGVMIISTPNNGSYQVTLPDGTIVWLNAATELKFTSGFSDRIGRAVRLTGEAYFEVAKMQRKTTRIPFFVITDDQEIEVLGTNFNVDAYPGAANVKTTLIEGLVRISPLLNNKNLAAADPAMTDPIRMMAVAQGESVLLKPNQQAILTAQHISIKPVDPQYAIAWTKKDFTFRNMPLETVMNVIADWYNVDVHYQDKTTKAVLLGGSIQRSDKLADVLSALSLASNLHFKTEGRQVTVK